MAQEPENKEAHINAAQLFYKNKDFQLAVEHYDQALEVEKNPQVASNRAKAMFQFHEQKRNEVAKQNKTKPTYDAPSGVTRRFWQRFAAAFL